MEILPKPLYGNLKRYWRRRRYQRLHNTNTNQKNLKIAKFGGGRSSRKFWIRIKAVPKLRLKIASPLKLLMKLKGAYVNMMVNLAGTVGVLNTANAFGEKRIPKARGGAKVKYSIDEVERRLFAEIYKALLISRELGDQKN